MRIRWYLPTANRPHKKAAAWKAPKPFTCRKKTPELAGIDQTGREGDLHRLPSLCGADQFKQQFGSLLPLIAGKLLNGSHRWTLHVLPQGIIGVADEMDILVKG